jgi:hypothetical protein
MADGELVQVAHGRSSQAPPPRILWDVLNDPLGRHRWTWLVIRENEQAPDVLSGTAPTELLWGSLWPGYPNLRLRFTIEPDGVGSMIHWSLLAPEDELNAEETEACRYRISYLVNDRAGLRGVFSQ